VPTSTIPSHSTARHSSSGRQPNFAALYKECNYGTFAEGATYIWLGGHHVGRHPTFLVCNAAAPVGGTTRIKTQVGVLL